MKTIRRHLLFQQSFLSPLQTARGIWKERTSLVLRQDCEGKTSFGEVAPLPGHSDLNFNEAVQEAKLWSESEGDSQNFPQLRPAISCMNSKIWDEQPEHLELPPTARLWGMSKPASNAVVKRKIGMLRTEQEIPIIKEWLKMLPVDTQVRLDPNESFSRDDLLRWSDALCEYSSIQFIEQPTGPKDDEWLIEHSLNAPVPIALDEAILRMPSSKDIRAIPHHLFLVIKPTLFPDWNTLICLGAEPDRKLIFSTSFESPFGYEALVRLSKLSCQSPGLDRSCFNGNEHEFSEHHQPILFSPSVSCERLVSLWDVLRK